VFQRLRTAFARKQTRPAETQSSEEKKEPLINSGQSDVSHHVSQVSHHDDKPKPQGQGLFGRFFTRNPKEPETKLVVTSDSDGTKPDDSTKTVRRGWSWWQRSKPPGDGAAEIEKVTFKPRVKPRVEDKDGTVNTSSRDEGPAEPPHSSDRSSARSSRVPTPTPLPNRPKQGNTFIEEYTARNPKTEPFRFQKTSIVSEAAGNIKFEPEPRRDAGPQDAKHQLVVKADRGASMDMPDIDEDKKEKAHDIPTMFKKIVPYIQADTKTFNDFINSISTGTPDINNSQNIFTSMLSKSKSCSEAKIDNMTITEFANNFIEAYISFSDSYPRRLNINEKHGYCFPNTNGTYICEQDLKRCLKHAYRLITNMFDTLAKVLDFEYLNSSAGIIYKIGTVAKEEPDTEMPCISSENTIYDYLNATFDYKTLTKAFRFGFPMNIEQQPNVQFYDGAKTYDNYLKNFIVLFADRYMRFLRIAISFGLKVAEYRPSHASSKHLPAITES
jgi:hypothetical protein